MSQVYVNPSQAGGLVLSELKVRRFRSLYEVSLPLKQINIFVGPNGSGKSNLISLFRLLHDITKEGEMVSPKRYGPRPRELIWFGAEEEETTFEITLCLEGPFGEPRLQYEITVAIVDDGNRFIFPMEKLADQTGRVFFSRDQNRVIVRQRTYSGVPLDEPYLRILGRGAGQAGLSPEESTTIERVFRFILGWRVPEISPSLIRESLSKGLFGPPPGKVPSLQPDGGNLHEFLYALWENEPDDFDLVRERLTAAVEFIEELGLVERPTMFGPGNFWEFKDEAFREYFSPYAQSDGTLRLLAILSLVLVDKTPSLICLEEPDHNLHPWLMLHLADALRYSETVGEPYPQMMITTHSPDFLDCFDPDEEAKYLQVFTVRKEAGRTHCVLEDAVTLRDWLKSYRLGDLFKKSVIGGKK